MDTPSRTAGLGALGVGAAACGAAPVLGFLAATGIASALGALVFGLVGLIVVLAFVAVLWARRRRRTGTCTPGSPGSPGSGPVQVDPPRLAATGRSGHATPTRRA